MRSVEPAALRRLVAEIRADRVALDARFGEVQAFGVEPRTAARTAALALTLDRFYTTVEAILERVAVALEGGLPEARDWHATLLRSAVLDIEGVRPRVLHAEVVAALDELRRFRHFVRHAYGASLDDSRVLATASSLGNASRMLTADLDEFERFLVTLADRLEQDG